MRLVVEKVDDFPGKKGARFADADFKLARRTLRNSDVAVFLRKHDRESFYCQFSFWWECTVDSHITQGKCQTTSVEDKSKFPEMGFLELFPDEPKESDICKKHQMECDESGRRETMCSWVRHQTLSHSDLRLRA